MRQILRCARGAPRLLVAVSLAVRVFAQEPGREPGTDTPEVRVTEEGHVEEIVVTGSRVPRKDLTTPAPVTVVSREEFLESGQVTIGEFLQLMPEQGNAMNRNVNNGGDGSLRVSLRGAGDHRTLVLLNGRRLVAGGNGADMSVDLGSIPAAAVERIEVLKDGASPIYGSDAIGGVVNVITRRAWSGTEVSAFSGIATREDGLVVDTSITTGRSTEGGSLLLSTGYTRQDPVWSGNRAWAASDWRLDMTGVTFPLRVPRPLPGHRDRGRGEHDVEPVPSPPGPYAVGSGCTPAGRVFVVNGRGRPLPNPGADPRIDFYNQLVTTYPTANSFVPDAGEPLGWRPWSGNALPEYGGDQYNYAPEQYLVTPAERLSLFAVGDVEVGSSARGFLEASYVSRRSRQTFAPEPFFSEGDGITLSADNEFNPFGVDLPRVWRRLTMLEGRTYTQDVETLRLLGGFGGTLPEVLGPLHGWTWETSLSLGRTRGTEVKAGYTRKSGLAAALGPSFRDTATGELRCGTGGVAIAGCVPIDLFGGDETLTAEQIAAVTFEGTAHGESVLSSFQAIAAGPLFPLPGSRSAGIALGYEYRSLSGTRVPDPVTAAGEASTDGSVTTTRGSQDVQEAYAELSLPVLEGRWLAESLEGLAAARVFKYGGFGTDWTWKLGGRWTPVRDVTLRGTLSTAFRAPSIWELHYGEAGNTGTVSDPCAGVDEAGNPAPASPWCARETGTPGEPFTNPLVSLASHGNRALRPETARVWTAGVVLEPRFADGLSVTVDAYGIRVDQTIGFVDALSLCYPMTAELAPQFCDLVQRDPSTYALTGILYTPVNAGSEWIAGVDFAVRYPIRTAAGDFRLSLDGTWLDRHDFVFPDGAVVSAKGTYDLPVGLTGWLAPEWKLNAGVSWRLGGLGAGASVRYLGSFTECASDGGVFGRDFAFCSLEHAWERRVPSYAVWDAFVGYRLTTAAGKSSVVLGAQNVFDRQAPTAYFSGLLPGDPGYDFVGRFVYARVSHRF